MRKSPFEPLPTASTPARSTQKLQSHRQKWTCFSTGLEQTFMNKASTGQQAILIQFVLCSKTGSTSIEGYRAGLSVFPGQTETEKGIPNEGHSTGKGPEV